MHFSGVGDGLAAFLDLVRLDVGLHLRVALGNFSQPVVIHVSSRSYLALGETFSLVNCGDGVLHLSQSLINELGLFLIETAEQAIVHLVDDLCKLASVKLGILHAGLGSGLDSSLQVLIKLGEELRSGCQLRVGFKLNILSVLRFENDGLRT